MYKVKKRTQQSENIKVDVYDICDNINLDKITNYKCSNITYMAYVFYFETHNETLQKISHLQSNVNGFNISGDNVLPIVINLLSKTITIKKDLSYKFNGVISFDLDMYTYTVKKVNTNSWIEKIKQYFNIL